MKVSDILKGKKAYQKEWMLKDENLEQEVVDKLSTDAAKSVRSAAIRHKNISQKALLKAATAKKNMEEKWIMRNIFWNLDAEHKWEFLKSKSWKLFDKTYIFEEIDTEFWSGIQKTTHKDELSKIFRDAYLEGDNYIFIRKWLLKYVMVKDDQELYDYFLKKYPEKLILYRTEQKLSKKDVSMIYNKYLDNDSWWKNPRNDLGSDFIEGLSAVEITKLIKSNPRMTKDDFVALKDNPNVTAKHTKMILDNVKEINEASLYLIEKFPLDSVAEMPIYNLFLGKQERNAHWKILEAWASNPTHSKQSLMDLLSHWNTDQGWSMNVVNNLLTTGNYTEEDLETIYKNKSDYYKKDVDKYMIDNPNFPKARLQRLWDKHWPKWGNKEVQGPLRINTFSGPDFKRFGMNDEEAERNHILYYLLKDSALKDDFAMEYYEATGETTYLSDEVKELFVF